ncbi:PspA-associated protein PspAB [Actinospica robiniae]|uniref:PspA-associated protein PspAB n=1 Tax=Actinospica robiniae TaxID=304901 RepID=UPI00041984E6|nr:hypothetical protein [Actinospica robiniae]
MGFLDSLLGRSKPVQPNLDQLFGLPSAAMTLEVTGSFRPTGAGSVCYRKAEGGAFHQVETDVEELLESLDGPRIEVSKDQYGYTWLTSRHSPDDMTGLVTDLHAVNTALQDEGFGSYLLCTLVGFRDDEGRKLALIYLYKRGSFYPFAPLTEPNRDNSLELQMRSELANDLRIEQDLGRWFAVWGAPGL